MKFLQNLQVKDKRILYRVDINSNVVNGKILDDSRIRSIVPTITSLLKAGAHQIILLAHQGRGKERSPETSLDAHAEILSKLLKKKVVKLPETRPKKLPDDPIVMLENVRLDDEDAKDPKKREAFARELSKLGDIYVNDAFGACHRDHATIVSLPRLMKEKACGLLLEKEIKAMEPLLKGKVKGPFAIVMGGAKINTKIGVMKFFAKKVDYVLLGGGLANTFLYAEGFDIGESLFEEEGIETAQDIIMELGIDENRLHLPTDVVCADEIGEDVETVDVPVEDVEGEMKILDIGKMTARKYAEIIAKCKTVLWNGPMGFAEIELFRHGSAAVAKAMAENKAATIIGGGESVAVINDLGISHQQFTHVSMGGGAMLEYLSGKKLPGIEALD